MGDAVRSFARDVVEGVWSCVFYSRSVPYFSACALVGLSCASAQAQSITSVGLVGQATFSAATPITVSTHTNGANATSTVGGLSGLTYDAARGVYYAISDDRGNLPRAGENIDPRIYTLSLNTSRTSGGSAAFGNQDVSFQSYTTLLRPNGTPFPFQSTATASDVSIDPEDIVLAPDGTGVYIASEGDKNQSTNGVVVANFVNKFDLQTGLQSAALPVPPAFQNTAAGNTASGPRQNLSFESLTISGNTLLTGTENALLQDGPINTTAGGTFSRLLTYDLTTGQPTAEFLYALDPILETGTVFSTAGLCDLLALGDGQYLALERSFTVGGVLGGGLLADGSVAPPTGYSVNLYQFSLSGVANGGVVNKQLLLNLNTLGIALDNIEGIELGGKLADGRQSLILVSDDNFTRTNGNGQNSPGQFTQFVVLGITQAPEPGSLGLLVLGLPVFAGVIRRRNRKA